MECELCIFWTSIRLTFFINTPVSTCPMVWRTRPAITQAGQSRRRILTLPSLLPVRHFHLWSSYPNHYITIIIVIATTLLATPAPHPIRLASNLINPLSINNQSIRIYMIRNWTCLASKKQLKGNNTLSLSEYLALYFPVFITGKIQTLVIQPATRLCV